MALSHDYDCCLEFTAPFLFFFSLYSNDSHYVGYGMKCYATATRAMMTMTDVMACRVRKRSLLFFFSLFFVSHMMDSPWLVQLSCSFRNASTSYEITRLGAVIDFYTRGGTW